MKQSTLQENRIKQLEAKLNVVKEYLCRIENATDSHSTCELSHINTVVNDCLKELED